MQKIGYLLTSRKFWAAIITLLIAFGVFEFEDAEVETIVQALVLLGTAVAYMIGTAIEDAGRHRGGQG